MKTTATVIGAIILAGTSLVLAAGNPAQQPAASPAPVQAPAKPATPAQSEPAKAVELTPEQKPIVASVEAFARAYSAGNAEALAGAFTEEAAIVDSEGTETRGRQAIAEMYASAFQQVPGLKLEATVQEIKFITPDVARVEGRSRLAAPSGDATECNRFSTLLVRKDGNWKAAEIREYPAPPEEIAPYERLRELEWMVGDWVDEGDENKITATVRWADNQSFLIREYAVEVKGERSSSGTMFIGWDPQTGLIKSWLFDSEGGRGEGVWTRTGDNQWVVKAAGVLKDGRATSATQIHTIVNKDSVKTSSIDRIIGGQIAQDILDIVMVRKPPQPTAGEAKQATPR